MMHRLPRGRRRVVCARHAADGMDQSAERVAQTMPVEETPCTTAAARRRLLRGPQRPGGARRVRESDARRWRRGRRGARCGFSAFERSFGYANNNNLVQPGYAMAPAPPRATASPAHETRRPPAGAGPAAGRDGQAAADPPRGGRAAGRGARRRGEASDAARHIVSFFCRGHT